MATYKLDGSKTTNQAGTTVAHSVAKWDGAKLVITTEAHGKDGKVEKLVDTWMLEGDRLIAISDSLTGGEKMRFIYTREK